MTEIKARRIEEQENVFRDEYGVAYRDGSIWSVERPALSGPSLDGYTFPNLTTDEHFEHLDEWIDAHPNRFRIVQLGMMFFERAWWMRGMDNFFMDLHLEPAFCEEMLDGLMEVCLGVVDRLLADYGDRIDAIGMSEDYGTEKSLMINPEIWRRFIRPRIARIFERVRLGGKYAYIHSCGHVTEIIPDLVDIGINMLQPIQPEAMDIFALKKEFGKDLCLVGGISTQRTLPFGTPQQVRDEVKRCLDVMADGGGYIMAPAKPILPGVPIENAVALLESFVNQR
jgi:uroporphyrinogen decarboxylase